MSQRFSEDEVGRGHLQARARSQHHRGLAGRIERSLQRLWRWALAEEGHVRP